MFALTPLIICIILGLGLKFRVCRIEDRCFNREPTTKLDRPLTEALQGSNISQHRRLVTGFRILLDLSPEVERVRISDLAFGVRFKVDGLGGSDLKFISAGKGSVLLAYGDES